MIQEEEKTRRAIKCFDEIRNKINTDGYISMATIESKAKQCGIKTTRLLDMLEGFDYTIDYKAGQIS